jgi:hypothetical protein
MAVSSFAKAQNTPGGAIRRTTVDRRYPGTRRSVTSWRERSAATWASRHREANGDARRADVEYELGGCVSFQGVFERDQADEVRPAQLSYQRYDNLLVCEYLSSGIRLAQDRGLQISLRVGVAQAQEIELPASIVSTLSRHSRLHRRRGCPEAWPRETTGEALGLEACIGWAGCR